jgi:hypothetical protein
MEDNEKYIVEPSVIPTNVLYMMVKNNIIDINPPYQRELVWESNTQSHFINSIHKNIQPNNIILNMDGETGKQTCLDGKQRVTSICNYMDNKIPLILLNGDEYEHIFYKEKPKKYKLECRVMSQKERLHFDNFKVRTVTYTGLTYTEQIDIFNRIQHGKELTMGEKIGALLEDIEDCKFLKDFCNNCKNVFDGYSSIDVKRKKHVEVISNILYLIDNQDMPTGNTREKYLNTFGKEKRISKKLQNIKDTIDKCFSKNILKNIQVPKKLLIKIMYSTILFVHNNNIIDYNTIINTLTLLHNKYYGAKIKMPSFKNIYIEFIKLYESLYKQKNKKNKLPISKKSIEHHNSKNNNDNNTDSDTDSDTDSETDSDTDSEN